MRLRHPDGSLLHLAYCSNVHPADDLDGVAAQLERYTARVRERLDVPVLGIGLWVAAPALADEAAARAARGAAAQRLGLEVVTLNGFPYKAFHAPVVKRDVYWPNWSEDERRDYTLGLARLLARLLPDDVAEGSISTLPLGWREGWGDAGAGRRRCAALADVARGARALQRDDRQADPAGAGARARLHGRDGRAGVRGARRARARVDRRLPGRLPSRGAVRGRRGRVGAGAPPACRWSRRRSRARCACRDPGSEEGRELLARFDEPRFLHQVRERVNSHVEGTDDLPEALDGGLPARRRVARALPRAGPRRRAHDAGRAAAPRWPRWPAAPRR